MDECTGLENQSTRKGTVGSNPTPSAKISNTWQKIALSVDSKSCSFKLTDQHLLYFLMAVLSVENYDFWVKS